MIFFWGFVLGWCVALCLASWWQGKTLERLRERIILRALERHGPLYGVPLWHEVGGSVGEVYLVLARLEERGWVTSFDGEATPERGNRAKKYFTLTDAGREALNEGSRVAADRA